MTGSFAQDDITGFDWKYSAGAATGFARKDAELFTFEGWKTY
jgi:hypothetical protein